MNINSEQLSPFLVEISSASQLLYLLHSFSIPAGDHTVTATGAKWRCGPRRGKVCKGGRVNKLVFNGLVSCCYLKHLDWKFLKQSAA